MTAPTAISAAEVEAVGATLRSFLVERAPVSSGRENVSATAVWTAMATELGLPAITIPEQYGGAGYGFAGAAAVLEELGRALTPVPYLSSAVLATQLLLAAGTPQARSTWLPRLAMGEVTAAVALVADRPDWSLQRPPFTFDRSDGVDTVTGRASYVADAAGADVILVVGPELGLGLVSATAAGVTVHSRPSTDPTRPLSDVDIERAAVERIGGGPGVSRALDVAMVGLACEQLGGARYVLDTTVAYAGTRTQFGRAIGSFQAIKHLLADALVDQEAAAAAVRYAVTMVDAGTDRELADAASVAQAVVSDAYWSVTRTAVQVHGAIGFTWEHDLHSYLRRALVSRQLLGSADWHRERLAAGLLDSAPANGRDA